jgi:hypothetical protein
MNDQSSIPGRGRCFSSPQPPSRLWGTSQPPMGTRACPPRNGGHLRFIHCQHYSSFMAYLTMSVNYTAMGDKIVNGAFWRRCQEAAVVQQRYELGICLKGPRKTTAYLSQNTDCPVRDSNRAPPEFEELPLETQLVPCYTPRNGNMKIILFWDVTPSSLIGY